MSMLDVLLRGIRAVSYLGTLLPSQPTIDFEGAGVSVANDAPGQRTVVTVPGVNTTTPIAPDEVTTANYSFPTGSNQRTLFDTTSNAITATLDTSPINGEVQGIKDSGRAILTNALTIATGGANIEYPPGTVTAGPLVFGVGGFTNAEGISVSWQWVTSQELWECLG